MLAAAAVLVLLAVAPAGAQASWAQIPSPNSPGSNELLGAAASDPTHVWAVGRVVSDTNPSTWRSRILRWNGSSWSSISHPSFARNHLLRGIDAPAANEAWAVGTRQTRAGGERTLVELWNGSSWSIVPSPDQDPGGLNELNGVSAIPGQPGNVWVVGFSSKPGGNFGTVNLAMRRIGGGWQILPTPIATAEDHLEAVDATSASSAWAVGWGSTSPFGGTAVAITLRWNGSAWQSIPVPQPSPIQLFGVTAVASNDVWAVGHTYIGGAHWIPLIVRWNGSTWSRQTIPIPQFGGQLRDVVALSPTNVYAVGLAGEGTFAETLVLHWNGTSWTRESTPSPAIGPKLFGAATVAPSTVWAVGHRYNSGLLANQTLTIRTTNG